MALLAFVEKIESKKTVFFLWVLALVSIILIRNLFEGLLQTAKTPDSFEYFFIQYVLFWGNIFLTFSIIMSIFGKEKTPKTGKVTIMFFGLILIVPVIDFFISGGAGHRTTYLFGDPEYLFSQISTFYAQFTGMGVTYGQKVEVLTALALVFAYCWIKTKKFLRSLIGIISLYFLIVLYLILPSIYGILVYGGQWEQIVSSHEIIAGLAKVMDFFYVILIAVQLIIWFWLWDKKKLLAAIRDIRTTKIIHYAIIMPFVGAIAFHITYSANPINFLNLIMLFFAIFFAFLASSAINDLSDLKIDSDNNKKRPLVKEALTKEESKSIIAIEILLALFSAVMISYPAFACVVCLLLLSLLYSLEPFRLKKFPFVSTFALAIISFIAVLAGYFASGAETINEFPALFGLFVILFVTFSFNVKDLSDIKGDKNAGIRTIPAVLGEKKARKVIALLVALSYLISPFLLKLRLDLFIPLSAVFAAINILLIMKFKSTERTLLIVYFIYAIIAGAFLLI